MDELERVQSAMGREFPPYRWVVEEGHARRFGQALSAGGTVPENGDVPPTYSVTSCLWGPSHIDLLKDVGLDTRYVVHGEQEFEITQPLQFGQEYTVLHRVADVAVKSGSRGGRMVLVVIETLITDAAGRLSVRELHTSIQTQP